MQFTTVEVKKNKSIKLEEKSIILGWTFEGHKNGTIWMYVSLPKGDIAKTELAYYSLLDTAYLYNKEEVNFIIENFQEIKKTEEIDTPTDFEQRLSRVFY